MIFPTYADDKTTRFRPLILPYIGLALWVGLGYNIGDAIRTSSPSYSGARSFMQVESWGVMFLIGAVAMAVASVIHDTKWMRMALFIGGVMYLWWGFLFAVSVARAADASDTSVVAPGLYAFIAFAHFAAAALPQRALPTSKIGPRP